MLHALLRTWYWSKLHMLPAAVIVLYFVTFTAKLESSTPSHQVNTTLLQYNRMHLKCLSVLFLQADLKQWRNIFVDQSINRPMDSRSVQGMETSTGPEQRGEGASEICLPLPPSSFVDFVCLHVPLPPPTLWKSFLRPWSRDKQKMRSWSLLYSLPTCAICSCTTQVNLRNISL